MCTLLHARDRGVGPQLYLTGPIAPLAAAHDPLRFLLQVNAVGETVPVPSLFEAEHPVKEGFTMQSIRIIIPGHQALAKALAVAAVYRKVLVQDLSEV